MSDSKRGAPGGAGQGGAGQAGAGQGGGAGDTALTVLTYVMLLVFGVAQSVLGTFFHSSGPAPLAAIGFDAAIFATCLLGGWGLRRPLGALAPAVGWLVPAFLFASGTGSGSVLIAASTAGEWFLFGGAVSAAAGVVVAFAVWSRPGARRPGGTAGTAWGG